MAKQLSKEDLKNIPGVGKDMEQHFRSLGICTISDLIGKDPEQMICRIVPGKASALTAVCCTYTGWPYIMLSTNPRPGAFKTAEPEGFPIPVRMLTKSYSAPLGSPYGGAGKNL